MCRGGNTLQSSLINSSVVFWDTNATWRSVILECVSSVWLLPGNAV